MVSFCPWVLAGPCFGKAVFDRGSAGLGWTGALRGRGTAHRPQAAWCPRSLGQQCSLRLASSKRVVCANGPPCSQGPYRMSASNWEARSQPMPWCIVPWGLETSDQRQRTAAGQGSQRPAHQRARGRHDNWQRPLPNSYGQFISGCCQICSHINQRMLVNLLKNYQRMLKNLVAKLSASADKFATKFGSGC